MYIDGIHNTSSIYLKIRSKIVSCGMLKSYAIYIIIFASDFFSIWNTCMSGQRCSFAPAYILLTVIYFFSWISTFSIVDIHSVCRGTRCLLRKVFKGRISSDISEHDYVCMYVFGSLKSWESCHRFKFYRLFHSIPEDDQSMSHVRLWSRDVADITI